ncbi:MAG: CbtA family protein [Methyloprofundus sp.]|nr:CbtA family protein [Methyloprofundus sp.]
MYFRNLILSAFTVAIVAGLFLSAYQTSAITPIILESEIYEVLDPVTEDTVEAWSPKDGSERSGFSFIANFLVCFAYALLLMSAMATRKNLSVFQGLFWGLCAYLSIFVAPAIGLSPEIPGMEAAHLEGRQAWWLLTVLFTALGLWSLAFQTITFKIFASILILTPHLIGAPQPEHHGFVNQDPEAIMALTDLWHQFIIQTSIANGLLWLIIGALSALLTLKFIFPLDSQE